MAAADEDALTCDFAETYHVLRYRALPARLAATLAAGLPDTARIRLRLAGASAPAPLMLEAAILDRLSLLVWMQTKDGQKNRRRPKSIAELLAGGGAQPAVQAFDREEDFWAAIRAADEG